MDEVFIKYALIGLLVWNLFVFTVYGLDKRRAKLGLWRIKENTLISQAFLFGGLGAFIGMRVFRHKTKHLRFKILVPLALVLNVSVVYLLYYFFN